MTELAPILLFVYNRPKHTERILESLLANDEANRSDLYIFSDGSKNEDDQKLVKEVRSVIKRAKGFQSIEIIERDKNWGLAENIIEGVTRIIKVKKKVIVLEDDLITAPFFLRFMNDALTTYANEKKVGHIQACDFINNTELPETFFIKWAGSWGWATWDRAWSLFERDGKKLLSRLKSQQLDYTFDFNGAYPFTKMLERQTKGINNSWAIRWNASLFLNNLLALNVGRSLVSNEGFDGSGTHCGGQRIYNSSLYSKPIKIIKTAHIEENMQVRKLFSAYYRRTNSFLAKAMRRIKQLTHIK